MNVSHQATEDLCLYARGGVPSIYAFITFHDLSEWEEIVNNEEKQYLSIWFTFACWTSHPRSQRGRHPIRWWWMVVVDLVFLPLHHYHRHLVIKEPL